MSGDRCGYTCSTSTAASPRYRRVLRAAFAINAVMFAVELTGSLRTDSVSLLVDAIDFLGDAANYRVWLTVLDPIGNIPVMAAAVGVFGTGAAWPDLAVAVVMSVLALTAAGSVVRQARGELRPHLQHA